MPRTLGDGQVMFNVPANEGCLPRASEDEGLVIPGMKREDRQILSPVFSFQKADPWPDLSAMKCEI